MTEILQSPSMKHYDVVVIGGAIMGASVAWYLTENPNFNGNNLGRRAGSDLRSMLNWAY